MESMDYDRFLSSLQHLGAASCLFLTLGLGDAEEYFFTYTTSQTAETTV